MSKPDQASNPRIIFVLSERYHLFKHWASDQGWPPVAMPDRIVFQGVQLRYANDMDAIRGIGRGAQYALGPYWERTPAEFREHFWNYAKMLGWQEWKGFGEHEQAGSGDHLPGH